MRPLTAVDSTRTGLSSYYVCLLHLHSDQQAATANVKTRAENTALMDSRRLASGGRRAGEMRGLGGGSTHGGAVTGTEATLQRRHASYCTC